MATTDATALMTLTVLFALFTASMAWAEGFTRRPAPARAAAETSSSRRRRSY